MSSHKETQSGSSSDEEKSKYYINQALFEALTAKGFSENAVKKSIVSGCIDEATCTQWIQMHDGHPELDTPLADGIEVIVRVKRQLTEEERAAKVQELREKARAKSEQEKREAFEEERRRIEMGRKSLDTKEMLDRLRCESALAEARRQKEADAVARRRVNIQIAADRYARQGARPEDALRRATEEFDAAAEERRRAAAERAKEATEGPGEGTGEGTGERALSGKGEGKGDAGAKWDLSSVLPAVDEAAVHGAFDGPAPSAADVPRLVEAIRCHQCPVAAQDCAALLRTILTNIRDNPFDKTKRTLRTSTRAFVTKIAALPPALQLLRACGFQLATDSSGGESVTATTVVLRVINNTLTLLAP